MGMIFRDLGPGTGFKGGCMVTEGAALGGQTNASARGSDWLSGKWTAFSPYWIELATEEKTLLAFDPIMRMVPTTTARITASMTAYSATS